MTFFVTLYDSRLSFLYIKTEDISSWYFAGAVAICNTAGVAQNYFDGSFLIRSLSVEVLWPTSAAL